MFVQEVKGYWPSTDISALRGYGGAGGSGTDPTRLSQPFPAPQRQGKSASNAEGNVTVCYKIPGVGNLVNTYCVFSIDNLNGNGLRLPHRLFFFFFFFVCWI